jgi:hypothetical protein
MQSAARKVPRHNCRKMICRTHGSNGWHGKPGRAASLIRHQRKSRASLGLKIMSDSMPSETTQLSFQLLSGAGCG